MNKAGVAFIKEITIDWELDAFKLAAQCWSKKGKWNLRSFWHGNGIVNNPLLFDREEIIYWFKIITLL